MQLFSLLNSFQLFSWLHEFFLIQILDCLSFKNTSFKFLSSKRLCDHRETSQTVFDCSLSCPAAFVKTPLSVAVQLLILKQFLTVVKIIFLSCYATLLPLKHFQTVWSLHWFHYSWFKSQVFHSRHRFHAKISSFSTSKLFKFTLSFMIFQSVFSCWREEQFDSGEEKQIGEQFKIEE